MIAPEFQGILLSEMLKIFKQNMIFVNLLDLSEQVNYTETTNKNLYEQVGRIIKKIKEK